MGLQRVYADGAVFFLRGAAFPLILCRRQELSHSTVQLQRGALLLLEPQAAQRQAQESRRQALIAFYRQLARQTLPARLAQLSTQTGIAYRQLRIRNQKTRWGSCSSLGNINLNLRLMMMPARVMDYVILHELCHLRELNHSPAFWQLLKDFCPDYQRWRAWLQREGYKLVF